MMSGLFFAISLASALARVGKSFFATVWNRCGGLLERGLIRSGGERDQVRAEVDVAGHDLEVLLLG